MMKTKSERARREEAWMAHGRSALWDAVFTARVARELSRLDIRPRAEHVEVVLNGRGLYICGPPGSGKTLYACATATEVYHQYYIQPGRPRVKIQFIHSLNLLEEVRASFGGGADAPTTTQDLLQHYGTVDLLILDDLGAERPTDWSLSILHLIINNRYEGLRPTIITSNLDLNTLGERLDDRISSRIYEMSEVVAYGQEDLRLRRRRNR